MFLFTTLKTTQFRVWSLRIEEYELRSYSRLEAGTIGEGVGKIES